MDSVAWTGKCRMELGWPWELVLADIIAANNYSISQVNPVSKIDFCRIQQISDSCGIIDTFVVKDFFNIM